MTIRLPTTHSHLWDDVIGVALVFAAFGVYVLADWWIGRRRRRTK